jgi:3-methylfumaryl-CoA hydratase
LTDWQPTTETRQDTVSPAAARALHDLLDRDDPAPHDGDPLPILWHWLAFLPQARQCEIGEDGHPRPGDFLPPTAGRRRMHAGGRVTVTGTPTIGAPLTRTSQVADVTRKRGSSGELLFVAVDHLTAADRGTIRERNDLVYRNASAAPSTLSAEGDIDADVLWGREVAIDPTVLFRFSALTYNAHRIHYDRDYATSVEGYPGLVVHGPLQAMLLADAAARAFPDRTVTRFAFRSTAPAFDPHPLHLRVRRGQQAETIELAGYSDGARTMTATAAFGEAA